MKSKKCKLQYKKIPFTELKLDSISEDDSEIKYKKAESD